MSDSMERRFLGLDYGDRRIGVAVSDPLNIIARGITVVLCNANAVHEISRLAREYDVEKIIIGLPLNLKGESGLKAKQVEEFIAKLQSEVRIPVERMDERFTSKIAHATLREMGTKKSARQAKGTIDEMAAALILQSYLDRRRFLM